MIFDKHEPLASYYCDLMHVVRSFSYQLDTKGQLAIQSDTPDPVHESQQFKQHAHDRLVRFIRQQMDRQDDNRSDNTDTAILPVIQMGPLGIRQDEKATMKFLGMAKQDWTIHLTSGYFNFTDRYKAMILRAPARFRFLTASPKVDK